MRTEGQGAAVSVAIVEDEEEVREGLRYFLGRDPRIRLAGAYPRAEDFLARLEGWPAPDIVLMDLNLPGMDGISATKLLTESHPALAVLILTVFEDEDRILASIRAGARGYILKNTRPEALLEQILATGDEGSPLSPTVARRILEELRRAAVARPASDYGLTPRELEVLRDIVDGLTYRELAERHRIAGSTAKKHILHLYRKLDVSSRAEIVRKALDERLV
jgi:DNA-binding NarL/FixJ family response regulator